MDSEGFDVDAIQVIRMKRKGDGGKKITSNRPGEPFPPQLSPNPEVFLVQSEDYGIQREVETECEKRSHVTEIFVTKKSSRLFHFGFNDSQQEK